MSKVYTFDLDVLAEQNLSIQEYLILLSLIDTNIVVDVKQSELKSLEEKRFVKIILEENEQITIIREKGRLFLDSVQNSNLNLINNKKTIKRSARSINNDINDFMVDFRNLWKGLKPGSMGSQNACNEKMTKWLSNNPTYKKEDVMRAAKSYIKSVNDYRFLQAADYFIYKKDAHGESSRLSAFIDEADAPNDEWSSQLI